MGSFRAGIGDPVSAMSDRVGGAGILGQVTVTNDAASGKNYTVPVPSGATWAFLEAIGWGGAVLATGSASPHCSGGGAGSDAIVEVSSNTSIVASIPSGRAAPDATTISVDGFLVVSAASAARSTGTTNPGADGKYPGATGSHLNSGGKGGGRLAGPSGVSAGYAPGYGGGLTSVANTGLSGGQPCVVVSFFGSREAALAFANAVYGGAWAP